MKPSSLFIATASLVLCTMRLFADGPDDNLPAKVRPVPPPGIEVPAETQNAFREEIDSIRSGLKDIPQLDDIDRCAVEGLVRAIEMTLEQKMFYSEAEVAMADKLLALANQRLEALRQGKRRLELLGVVEGSEKPQLIVSGFRSKLDSSIQPYGLVVPPKWKPAPARRLDIWLHGRDEKTSEVGFLNRRLNQLGEFAPADSYVLHPYGRYSNAFKFAGEIDVLEALENVSQLVKVDPLRVSIRGFSMGGAGCWQMAVHYPDRWFAATPGAGFCETSQFLSVFQKEEFKPTPFQKSLLHWYDCPDWSNNLRLHQTIAYSGELDRQKQAADVMEESMKSKGMKLTHVIGPGTEHKFHPDAKKTIEAQMQEWSVQGRNPKPRKIDFTTYTLRYPSDSWVRLERLGKHWEEARIQAEVIGEDSIEITTKNVRCFSIDLGQAGIEKSPDRLSVKIDGAAISVASLGKNLRQVTFKRESGAWKSSGKVDNAQPTKRPGIQGPIDDAFLSKFLFVSPNMVAAPNASDRWIAEEFKHATQEWRRHFRGDIVAKSADKVTAEDIASSNLILFGTPESNPLIAKIASSLPAQWKANKIQIGSHQVSADQHVVAMVFPNPLNPERYVVLNSGFTFREFAYLNNARQIPMLPDWALIDVSKGATSQMPGEIPFAGFFDEEWKFQP